MRKKRDTAPEKQLALEFDTIVATPETSSIMTNNVVHVQFGMQKTTPLSGSPKDRALIERILQSAQRLKW